MALGVVFAFAFVFFFCLGEGCVNIYCTKSLGGKDMYVVTISKDLHLETRDQR